MKNRLQFAYPIIRSYGAIGTCMVRIASGNASLLDLTLRNPRSSNSFPRRQSYPHFTENRPVSQCNILDCTLMCPILSISTLFCPNMYSVETIFSCKRNTIQMCCSGKLIPITGIKTDLTITFQLKISFQFHYQFLSFFNDLFCKLK